MALPPGVENVILPSLAQAWGGTGRRPTLATSDRAYWRNPLFTSSCESNRIGTGFTFQMSSQYWPMVRSEENFPQRAALRTDIRVQRSLSRYACVTSS